LSRFDAERSAAESLGYADPESVFATVAQHWMARIEEAENFGHAESLVTGDRRFVRVCYCRRGEGEVYVERLSRRMTSFPAGDYV
jgi:hypothetical protein